MSCVLRVSGKYLDIETLLTKIVISPIKVWRAGTRRYLEGSSNNAINQDSGATFEISEASFSDLLAQIRDAENFFLAHRVWLTTLASFNGVEHAVADFAVESSPPHWASFSFPPKLLAAMSAFNVSLCVSVYPVEEASNESSVRA